MMTIGSFLKKSCCWGIMEKENYIERLKEVKKDIERSIEFERKGLDNFIEYISQEPNTNQEQEDKRFTEKSMRIRTITTYKDALNIIERHFPELKN